jgi:DNA primase
MSTGRISDDKIQEVRDRVDIVEVVSSYLPLKRSGANHLGLCPFHAEKTPSFNVNGPRQIYHCFGCGVGGDVFSFVMRMEGLSFPEAVRRLAERAGVEIGEQAPTPEEERRRAERDRLLRISEVACDFYHRLLLEDTEGAPGRRYLRQRGYQGDMVREFRLGFAPDRWEALSGHLAGKGFDPKWARDVLGLTRPGKAGRGDFDLFRKRLLFPIQDSQGRVVAFGGRVLDDSLPKYINSPESPIYHKGRILYGLYQAKEAMRRGGEGIVVEGYFDQLALYRAGIRNVVATCGTALTADHARLLKRYCQRLLLFFDQDAAGRQATFRAMDALLAEGLSAAVVELPAGEDPDSFLRRHSVEELEQKLKQARPVLQVFMEEILGAHGDSIEGKARAAEEVVAKLQLLPSVFERDLYLKELAQCTGLDEALLKSRAGRRVSPPSPLERPAPPVSGGKGKLPARPEKGAGLKAQECLLHLMQVDAAWCHKAAEDTPDRLFVDDDCRAIAQRLIACCVNGEKPDETVLYDGLSEAQKGLLSGIIIKDDQALAEQGEQIYNDCRKAVEKERLKIRQRELRELIRQAEAAGDDEQRAALQRESVEVLMKIKGR